MTIPKRQRNRVLESRRCRFLVVICCNVDVLVHFVVIYYLFVGDVALHAMKSRSINVAVYVHLMYLRLPVTQECHGTTHDNVGLTIHVSL